MLLRRMMKLFGHNTIIFVYVMKQIGRKFFCMLPFDSGFMLKRKDL